jgi:hypothetical protein
MDDRSPREESQGTYGRGEGKTQKSYLFQKKMRPPRWEYKLMNDNSPFYSELSVKLAVELEYAISLKPPGL